MRLAVGYLWIAATIAFTVYGQLAFKWRVDEAAEIPRGLGAKVEYGLRFALDPWMISVALAVVAASVTWWLTLRTFELSFAYPFMSLSFAGVLLLSSLLFGERLSATKVLGVVLIAAGLAVGSRP
jgi:multidrug transporter EmrE-like cation transporter